MILRQNYVELVHQTSNAQTVLKLYVLKEPSMTLTMRNVLNALKPTSVFMIRRLAATWHKMLLMTTVGAMERTLYKPRSLTLSSTPIVYLLITTNGVLTVTHQSSSIRSALSPQTTSHSKQVRT
jgi:hypothetical protein